MENLVVHQWTRFDHDRLYVKTQTGFDVGYMDRRTGATHLTHSQWRPAFDVAVSRFLAGVAIPTQPGPGRRPSRPEAAATTAPVVEPPWTDLTDNLAGQAVRVKADELRSAAPIRSLACRLLGVDTEERRWRLGAAGEVAVARRLDRLDGSWTVLHAVPVGDRGSDIDHVVIGPGGVVTVNTKNHPRAAVWVGGDTFMVNGHRQRYVHNSRHEAARAARLLSARLGFDVPVVGVIAVVGASRGLTIRQQPRDVTILACRSLDRWLTGRPAVLRRGQAELVVDAARRSTTWTARVATGHRLAAQVQVVALSRAGG